MCGIFGVIARNGQRLPHVDSGRVIEALQSRGPDGHGAYRDASVHLVHTRLALVDPNARSNQPMWDSSGRYCIVYNGELYRYSSVRKRLESEGVDFSTTSDTEVLVEAIARWGVEVALKELDGMFAFGVYDRIEQTLTIARDRVGMKPLFVLEAGDVVAFASSVQALHAWRPLQPDLLTVHTFLDGVAAATSGRSYFENVRVLEAGTLLRFDSQERTVRRFASWNQLRDSALESELSSSKPSEWVDRLDALLCESIRSQLLADAPVGALCSGGVDSALVAAIAHRHVPELKIFHADVVGPQSERAAAQRVADFLKSPLHVISIDERDLVEQFAQVTYDFGFPFLCHANSIPFMRVCELAHKHNVKAVLCGEGADECFLGYEWLVPNVRKAIVGAPRNWMRSLKSRWTAIENRLRGKAPRPTQSHRDRELVRAFPSGLEREFEPALIAHAQWDDPLDGNGDLSRLTESGHLPFIMRTLFHRNDSLGMSKSIEARYPVLDRKLLRFAINLPKKAKIRIEPRWIDWHHLFLRDKWVWRQVAKRYLPRSISEQKKRAFNLPVIHRLAFDARYFKDSVLRDWYRVSERQMRCLVEQSSPRLKLRMASADVWGRMFFRGETAASVTQYMIPALSNAN